MVEYLHIGDGTMKVFYHIISIICLLAGIGVGISAWIMYDHHIDIQPLANAVALIGFVILMTYLAFHWLWKGF